MRPVLLAALFSCCALAQLLTEPPNLIRVVRSPGAAGPLRDNGGNDVTVLGLSAITGLPEAWRIEAHPSFESIEALDHAGIARNDEAPLDTRTFIAFYRAGASFRPALAMRGLPRARYMRVSLYRIRPGTEAEFADIVAARQAAFERLNLDMPELAFRVVFGDQSGTYLFLAPLSSLRTIDNELTKMPGPRDPERGKVAADIVLSHEEFLLRIEPAASRVPPEFTEADPEFWKR